MQPCADSTRKEEHIKMAITIKDVAARCGLSVSTVSKAFNHYCDISEQTREMVQRTAREMGYYPNAIARTLKTNRSFNLGILLVDEGKGGLTHEFFAMILEGFKSEAERRGYDVTFINHNIGRTAMSYLEHCRYRNVDGVCLACADFTTPQVSELAMAALPCITIDHVYPGRACVFSENQQGMDALVRHAFALGHRRIAYAHGQPSVVTEHRISGYRQAMAACGIAICPEWLQPCAYSRPDQGREAALKLLRLPDPPTCLLMPDDYACLGALEAATELGLRVPEDLSVGGYDGVRLAQLLRPRLTTIYQDACHMGILAAQRLVDEIEGSPAAAQKLIAVTGKLLVGESIGPVACA